MASRTSSGSNSSRQRLIFPPSQPSRPQGTHCQSFWSTRWDSPQGPQLKAPLGPKRATAGVSTAAGAAYGAIAAQNNVSFNGHIVRAGLNYHFNWAAPAPVVAKY